MRGFLWHDFNPPWYNTIVVCVPLDSKFCEKSEPDRSTTATTVSPILVHLGVFQLGVALLLPNGIKKSV